MRLNLHWANLSLRRYVIVELNLSAGIKHSHTFQDSFLKILIIILNFNINDVLRALELIHKRVLLVNLMRIYLHFSNLPLRFHDSWRACRLSTDSYVYYMLLILQLIHHFRMRFYLNLGDLAFSRTFNLWQYHFPRYSHVNDILLILKLAQDFWVRINLHGVYLILVI